MAWFAEHTDTFNGEANYNWVKRLIISDNNINDRTLIREVKSHFHLTGVKCDRSSFDDMIELRPRHMHQIVFISWLDDEDIDNYKSMYYNLHII